MKYVLLVGHPRDGYTVLGPFDSEVEANDWASVNCPHSHFEAMMLHDPAPAGRRPENELKVEGDEDVG